MYAAHIILIEDLYSGFFPNSKVAKAGDALWLISGSPKDDLLPVNSWGVPYNVITFETASFELTRKLRYAGNPITNYVVKPVKIKPFYVQNGWEIE